MRKKIFWISLLFIITIITLTTWYLTEYYDITHYYFLECIFITYAICLPFSIYRYRRTLIRYHRIKSWFNRSGRKRKIKFSPVGDLLSILIMPLVYGFIISVNLTYFYTYYAGQEIQYSAKVYDKEIVSGKRKKYHIYVRSELLDEEKLTCQELYNNTQINSEILIKRKHSSLGSYVKYSEIQILKNESEFSP